MITLITNNNNNNNNNNNKVINIKGRGEWEKTLKHYKIDMDAPNTKLSKTTTTCNGTHIKLQQEALTLEHRKLLCTRPSSVTNPDDRKRHSTPPKRE